MYRQPHVIIVVDVSEQTMCDIMLTGGEIYKVVWFVCSTF